MSDKQTDAPKKWMHWANDYGSYSSSWHKSRKHANEAVIGPRIAVIRREWVEGQPPQYFTERV